MTDEIVGERFWNCADISIEQDPSLPRGNPNQPVPPPPPLPKPLPPPQTPQPPVVPAPTPVIVDCVQPEITVDNSAGGGGQGQRDEGTNTSS